MGIFSYAEIESALKTLTETRHHLLHSNLSDEDRKKIELLFCQASGFFKFYDIEVKFKEGVGYRVVSPNFDEKIISEDIINLVEVLKKNYRITNNPESKVAVQIVALLEDEGYSVRYSEGDVNLVVSREPFSCGK